MTRRAGDIYDELLIMRCQDGDSKALETLTTRWHTRLLRYAHRHLGDHDAAHDVVQEGWLAIVRGIHKLDAPQCSRPGRTAFSRTNAPTGCGHECDTDDSVRKWKIMRRPNRMKRIERLRMIRKTVMKARGCDERWIN